MQRTTSNSLSKQSHQPVYDVYFELIIDISIVFFSYTDAHITSSIAKVPDDLLRQMDSRELIPQLSDSLPLTRKQCRKLLKSIPTNEYHNDSGKMLKHGNESSTDTSDTSSMEEDITQRNGVTTQNTRTVDMLISYLRRHPLQETVVEKLLSALRVTKQERLAMEIEQTANEGNLTWKRLVLILLILLIGVFEGVIEVRLNLLEAYYSSTFLFSLFKQNWSQFEEGFATRRGDPLWT